MLASLFASLFRRIGHRKPETRTTEATFYSQVATCQIPNLWYLYELVFGKKSSGCFVEIGGHDGVFVSNSWGLAEAGWSGVIAEPVPEFSELCRANHLAHPSVRVCEVAISSPGHDRITLNVAGALSTASHAQYEEYKSVRWARRLTLENRQIEARSQTLDQFLEDQQVPQGFDVLIVDVEGYEESVFQGFSVMRWKPTLMIIELANTHPDLRATRTYDSRLQLDIESCGYEIIYKDWINTVFLRSDVFQSVVS
jgi:FkbM family methyltransferase